MPVEAPDVDALKLPDFVWKALYRVGSAGLVGPWPTPGLAEERGE